MTVKRRVLWLLSLALVLIAIGFRSMLEIRVFSVDDRDVPGWFIIERGVPSCESERARWWGRLVTLPRGGFLCTSDPIREGWYLPLVWNRSRGRLVNRDQLRVERATYLSRCNFVAEEFFVGPESSLSNAADKDNEVIRAHRPDCFVLPLPDGGTLTIP